MAVEFASNGEIQLAYETFGDASGEPLLLITGLGHQMLLWPDRFCEALVAAGFHVARFDNRDSGMSTYLDSPDQRWWQALLGGGRPPYTSDAFVDDAVAVMDALGWQSAHVAGASMGSAIGQMIAVRHPERVRSLTALMSMPASGSLLALRHIRFGSVLRMGRMRHGTDRAGQEQRIVDLLRMLASPRGAFDETWAREVAARGYDRRPFDPRAERRQLAAGRSRRQKLDLGRLKAPTLIVYGQDDPLVRPSGPKALARAIPGSRLVGYPGMGHDLPEPQWAELVGEMRALAQR
ncbi:alpha/beta hydrolase [Catellatospora sp. KI3]|uniref:alpha/beta fold hydrolase n=1 Tax=Catellatospora sp. KI3 TaxID=3041620 RepID=UPI0024832913|nr:alpha/beta hydrolase [Catellatospora sp. KI3]MDI1463116.1 alpha/beta hydrolase [Catellatospora sp. KI3]